MTKVFFIAFLAICIHTTMDAEIIRTRYSNGNILSIVNYTDGKLNGSYTAWYKNGEKATEGYFTNDKKEGVWREWYKNGQLAVEQNFIDGQLNGDIKVWYPNGIYRIKGSYTKNARDSAWIYYCDNGKIKNKVTFNFGIVSKWEYPNKQWYDSVDAKLGYVNDDLSSRKQHNAAKYLIIRLFNLVYLPALSKGDSTRWLWLSDDEHESFESNIYIGKNGLIRKFLVNSYGNSRNHGDKNGFMLVIFWQDHQKNLPHGKANGLYFQMYTFEKAKRRTEIKIIDECMFNASYQCKNNQVIENITNNSCPCLYFEDVWDNNIKVGKKQLYSDSVIFSSDFLFSISSQRKITGPIVKYIISNPYFDNDFNDSLKGDLKLISKIHKKTKKAPLLTGVSCIINPKIYWADVEARYPNGVICFKGKTSSNIFDKWQFYAENGQKIATGEYYSPDVYIPNFVYGYYNYAGITPKNGIWKTWKSNGKPLAWYNFYKGWLIDYKEY